MTLTPAAVDDTLDAEAVAWLFAHHVSEINHDDLTADSPEWMLRIAATSSRDRVRAAVAKLEHCPPDLLVTLLEESDPGGDIHWAATVNPNCPPTILEGLAARTDSYSRSAAAANPSTPEAVLVSLSFDGRHRVLFHLAANPSSPPHILSDFARHEDIDVRCRVARNPSLPDTDLNWLIESGGYEVQSDALGERSRRIDAQRKRQRR